MTDQQIKWAAQHDWYVGHGVNVENQLFIRVKEDTLMQDPEFGTTYGRDVHDFTDYQALRAWAGY